MKSPIYLYVLVAVVCLLSACGGHSAEKKLYNLEKLQSKALEAEQKILGIKPELATKENVLEVMRGFQVVVDDFQTSYPQLNQKTQLSEDELRASGLAAASQLRIGQLSILAGDSTKAREVFEQFENRFPHNLPQQKVAWLNMLQIFNNAKDWDKLEEISLKLIEKFDPPLTDDQKPDMTILIIPFQLMRFYIETGDQAKGLKYTQFAEDYYKRLREKYPTSNLGLAATRLLAETYKYGGQAQKAIDLLVKVTDSTGQMSKAALLLTAQAYFENLNNPTKALEYYQKLYDRGFDSAFTPQTLMEMGQVLLLEKRFPEARVKLKMLIDQYKFALDYLPKAQRLLAISYEEEKNYDQAQENYLFLIENYPTHSQAFEIYAYLPEFFNKQGKKQLADQWYNRAESFFKETEAKYKERTLGAAAQEYLCEFYARYEKWQDAVAALNFLATQFPDYRFTGDAYFRIGAIFESKLNVRDSARYYYDKQIRTFPNLAVSKKLEEKLKTF